MPIKLKIEDRMHFYLNYPVKVLKQPVPRMACTVRIVL